MTATPHPTQKLPWPWIIGFLVIYIITVMPVGLFIYTLKMDANLNLLNRGGFHAYLQCLEAAAGRPLPKNLRLEPPGNVAAPHAPSGSRP